MMFAVDLLLPSLRCWRRRRRMFSTSMIASSTTPPTAITSPARTIVLIVAPRIYSTSPAAISDNGIATRLIRAVRHSKRKAKRTSTTSRQEMSSALVRLSTAILMKFADRKMVESICIPGRPGRSDARVASTPRVTSNVLAHGNFSTTSRRPGPLLMTASPMSGW